jgi:DNA-binding beta-propeller fold protein YncE
VISTATNTIVARICLGSDTADDLPGTPGSALTGPPPAPCDAETDHHKPFYDGHVAPHGLWLTPDQNFLLITNRISGTVVAVDTRLCDAEVTTACQGAIVGYTPVGREPHLATVRPGGAEAWVAVRGETYLDVLKLDPASLTNLNLLPVDRMPRTASIVTPPGPSMVSFTTDGRFAFVAFGKAAVVQKIDAASRQILSSAPLPAPFTPFGLVSPDNQELYLVHKSLGRLSILKTSDLSPLADIAVGPCANHVAFAGDYAYVTIGGTPPCAPGGTDREGKIVMVNRMTRAVERELTGPTWTGDPHGIWTTPDQTRLYIGHERGNRVTVLGTGNPNNAADDAVLAVIAESGDNAALMRQPIDVVIKGEVPPPPTPTVTVTTTQTATASPTVAVTATGTATTTPVASATPTRTPTAAVATPTPLIVEVGKVGICHATGSRNNPFVFMVVDAHAVPAHSAHGDIIGVGSARACESRGLVERDQPTAEREDEQIGRVE